MTDLDGLPTDQLRRRAFELAERRHDVGFFWDLVRHLPPSGGLAGEDASSGHITGGIVEAVELVRQLLGHGVPSELEPLLRTRFIGYLREHGAG